MKSWLWAIEHTAFIVNALLGREGKALCSKSTRMPFHDKDFGQVGKLSCRVMAYWSHHLYMSRKSQEFSLLKGSTIMESLNSRMGAKILRGEGFGNRARFFLPCLLRIGTLPQSSYLGGIHVDSPGSAFAIA
jgi:hypothetical protein